MMKKVGIIKRVLCISLVFLLNINALAAVVSDNDGSAFITKAEFDSLKNNFQSQIDQYNTSIDSKIDGAIAAYLSGIKISKESDRKIEMQDKQKVLSIGTTNAPRYEYDEAMIQCQNGGILTAGNDGAGQADRRRTITLKGLTLKGNPEKWNNPQQKKVAIKNVNPYGNAEFVDYYNKCGEKVTLGLRATINPASGYVSETTWPDEYVSFFYTNGKNTSDQNWDLTLDPGIMGYASKISDETTGKYTNTGHMYGNWYISSAETKFTDPADYYINVFKSIPHKCWSNYEYNSSWPGESQRSNYDTYVQDMMLNNWPGYTDHTDGTYLSDAVAVEFNNRWKDATENGTDDNTFHIWSCLYNAPETKYGWNEAEVKILGGLPYGGATSQNRRGGMFCLGWDTRISNWNQLWYAGYDRYVDFYDAKTYPDKNKTLDTGKDGKKHLFLAAGFPLLSVEKDETVKYNFRIQESGDYDLWIKNLPFVSSTPWLETGLVSAKNTSTGAAATTTVALVGGGANNNVEFLVPEDGYIWIKWAKHETTASNYNGLGTLLLEPTARVVEPEE